MLAAPGFSCSYKDCKPLASLPSRTPAVPLFKLPIPFSSALVSTARSPPKPFSSARISTAKSLPKPFSSILVSIASDAASFRSSSAPLSKSPIPPGSKPPIPILEKSPAAFRKSLLSPNRELAPALSIASPTLPPVRPAVMPDVATLPAKSAA